MFGSPMMLTFNGLRGKPKSLGNPVIAIIWLNQKVGREQDWLNR
jgi:hypothetical protein